MSNNLKINLPDELRFLIVGSGDPVKTFLKKINEIHPNAYVFVLSDKNSDDLWSLHEKKSIKDIANSFNYQIKYIKDINNKMVFRQIKKNKCNICFVLGSKCILNDDLINYFDGRIFNYHASNLPNYKGGGGYRWQIMNNENEIHITFHQLTSNIDSGPILKTYSKKFINKLIYPRDFHIQLYKFTNNTFPNFLKILKKNTINLKKQDNQSSIYYPLLDNNFNAAVDLSWNIDDIYSFIRAFSYPYTGAFLYYQGKKYFIKEAKPKKNNTKFHPYAIGLIINVTEDNLDVILYGGILSILKITNNVNETVDFSIFRLGNRFYDDKDELVKSRLYRPSNKKFTLKIN